MVSMILSLCLIISFLALVASLIDMLRRDDATNAVLFSGVAMIVSFLLAFAYMAYCMIRWYL